MKPCPDCQQTKEDGEFGRLSPRCRICAVARRRVARREASDRWIKLNRQKRLDICKARSGYNAAYRRDNRSECNKRSADWASRNASRKQKSNQLWYLQNSEVKKQSVKRWSTENRDKVCAKSAAYRASKINACPPWADLDEIERIYAKARQLTEETGIEHHVDHIYPLRSKWLCGLHIPINLQILTGPENRSKSNVRWPGCEALTDAQPQEASP
jgi:hypothetical protein